jgi:hypothetical protein
MSKSKPDGYWKNLENCMSEALNAMAAEGWTRLPGEKKLRAHRYCMISAAITKYHGGMHEFRKHLRQQSLRREDGLWKDLAYAIQQAREAMKKEGWKQLPGEDVMRKCGYGSLIQAIHTYHDGIRLFRKYLGQEQLEREKGSWLSFDYTLQQAHEAMHKEGWTTLPSQLALAAKGYSSLSVAIVKYHGGMHEFRKHLGQESLQRQSGIWKDLSYTIQQAKEAMTREGWNTLPTQDTLATKGYSSLGRAISTYHGGFPAFRAKLNAALGINPGKEQLEEIIKEYLK